jgi:O-antigen ligase
VTLKIKTFMFVFCLWLFLASPYPGFAGEIYLRIIDLFMLAFVFILNLAHMLRNKFRVTKNNYFLLFVFILLAQLVSILLSNTSVSFLVDLAELYRYILFGLAFCAGYWVFQSLNTSSMSIAVLGVFFFVLAICVVQYLFGPSMAYYLFSGRSVEIINEQFVVRIIGTLGNPNYLGFLSVAFSYWALAKVALDRNFNYLVVFTLAVGMLLFSQSRTAVLVFLMIGSIFLFGVFVSSSFKFGQKIKLFGLSFLIAMFSAIVFYGDGFVVFAYLQSGFRSVVENGLENQSSFGARLEIWNWYLGMIVQEPWFGFGPSKGFFLYDFADNNFLLIMFRYGLVGLLCILLLWCSILWRLGRISLATKDPLAVFSLAMGGCLMLSSVTADALDNFRISATFFLLAGMILGKNRLKNSNSKK